MPKLKITGRRGSWFARVEGRGEPLPIMWADEITNQRLTTDWMLNGREETAYKREQFRDFFEPHVGEVIEFIVARAKDPNSVPRELDKYVAVFSGRVLGVTPEIDLEILSRVADSK
jgi:hypothetical protein